MGTSSSFRDAEFLAKVLQAFDECGKYSLNEYKFVKMLIVKPGVTEYEVLVDTVPLSTC